MRNTHIARSYEERTEQTIAMQKRKMRYVTFVVIVVVAGATLLLAFVPFIFVSFQHAIGNRIIIINHLEKVLRTVRYLRASKFSTEQFDFT